MANHFNNTPTCFQQLAQLGKCRLWAATNSPTARHTFRVKSGHRRLWRSGSEPGLNMRDSGLIFPGTPCVKKPLLRSVLPRRKATENGFKVGTYEELIPQADR